MTAQQIKVIRAGFAAFNNGRDCADGQYLPHNALCAWKAAADCVINDGKVLDSWRKFNAMPALRAGGAAFKRWELAHYEMTLAART